MSYPHAYSDESFESIRANEEAYAAQSNIAQLRINRLFFEIDTLRKRAEEAEEKIADLQFRLKLFKPSTLEQAIVNSAQMRLEAEQRAEEAESKLRSLKTELGQERAINAAYAAALEEISQDRDALYSSKIARDALNP